MKKKLFSCLAIILNIIFLLGACSKEKNNGNGEITYKIEPSNLSVSVGSTVLESGLPVTVNSNSSLTWKAGYATISQLYFEATKESQQAEYKLKKSTTIDLFKQSQEVGKMAITAGLYKDVELQLIFKKQITGDVFAINGVFTDESGKQTQVDFNYNEDLTLNLSAENLNVSNAADYTGLLELQLNKLIIGITSVDLKTAIKNSNSTIVISSSSNVDLFNKIKTNIQSFAKADFKTN